MKESLIQINTLNKTPRFCTSMQLLLTTAKPQMIPWKLFWIILWRERIPTSIFGSWASICQQRIKSHIPCTHSEPLLNFLPVPHIKYSRLQHLFHGVNLDFDDEVYIYQVNSNGSKSYYQLYEVYKISDGSVPVVGRVGNWSKGNNNSSPIQVKEDKIKRRNDLRVSIHASL